MPRDYNVYVAEQPGTQWLDGTIVKPPHKHKAGGNGLRPVPPATIPTENPPSCLDGRVFQFLVKPVDDAIGQRYVGHMYLLAPQRVGHGEK